MKKQLCAVAALFVFSAGVLAPQSSAQTTGKAPIIAPENQEEKSAQIAFGDLMSSIQDNDYQAFLMAVDDNMKAALPKAAFEKVVAQLAPRQRKGYTSTYLGALTQKGYRVHLWKLSFDDKGDDILAQLSIKDKKIGGFFLH